MKTILPVHLMKLRWLLSQAENLLVDDRVAVNIIVQEWDSDNYKVSDSELLTKVNDLFDRYNNQLKYRGTYV